MTSMTALPPIPQTIASIAGPPLVGIMLNWFLYGILVTQTYVNAQCFPDDKKKIKFLVYGIFALDTIQSILSTADAFHWFAEGYGNMLFLADPHISPLGVPILGAIIAFIVQVFFCWRIWILGKSMGLPILVSLTSLAGVGGGFAVGIGAFQLGDLTLLNKLTVQFCFWLGGSALADTLIAIIMTWLLLRAKSRSEHQNTDNILVKIVRLTVETNTVTASVAIVALVCLLAVNGPDSTASVAPGYVLAKLYSNTLMAVFNNRVYMSGNGLALRLSGQDNTTVSGMRFGELTTSRSHQTKTGYRQGPHRLQVFQETETTSDLPMKDFEMSKASV
ncbi:hypothetical protein FPV67DRAFT_1159189 [Lyophyllum atratum]|nr:hypothetical protein FPV67DRAFT_1159189 [Lyophyllum atratum]